MLREDKERVVAELVERLKTSETLLVADYRGLTHAELDSVRTELLKLGARFAVVKNTLTRRAADAAGIDALGEFLTGPTAIAFVIDGDAVGVARTLSETARQTRRLELKGGLLAGKTITADAVRELATLPPADVLRAQLLAAIVGPMASIVGIFSAPLRELVGVIDARIRQLEEQGSGPVAPSLIEEAAETTPEALESSGEAVAEPPEPAAPAEESVDELAEPEAEASVAEETGDAPASDAEEAMAQETDEEQTT